MGMQMMPQQGFQYIATKEVNTAFQVDLKTPFFSFKIR